LSDENSWLQICTEVQQRSLTATFLEVESAKKLRTNILKLLTTARDDRVLNAKLHKIHELLKLRESRVMNRDGFFEIMGGQKNFKRDEEIPHFKRYDGCWFDFAITIDGTTSPAQIIAFDFEIRFPKNCSTAFLRFDLNLPGHDNEDRHMRFHLHPGNDDLMIHSPPMSPIEILHLFLYGLALPDKLRS
jgi:hypothetical protein